MQQQLHKWLAIVLAVSLLLPMLLIAPGSALADGSWTASIDEALDLSANASDAQRAELVNVALELAGEPVVKTYVALKAQGASKTDLAKGQQARKADLEKAQAPVVAALKTAAPKAILMSQHQALVNAIIVRVPRGDVAALRTIRGVTHVSEVADAALDLGNSVPYIGAQRVAMELGITGRGMRVGILDSGIDYTHRNYGGPGTMAAYMAAVTDLKAVTETVTITDTTGHAMTTTMFPTEKIPGGWDFLGDQWPNSPDSVLEPDADPMDPAHTPFTGGHGSHVSGITGGMGVPNASFNGSIPADSTFGGTTVYHGVAPAAKLYAYKVCSSVSTSCSGVAMVQAFERTTDPNQDGDMSDHLDALNMSIGSTYGANRVTKETANNTVLAGVAVAISAGNSANFPFISGAPSIAERVVSVANNFAANQYAQVGVVDAPASLAGRRFLMIEQSWAPSLASAGGNIAGDLVYIGRACPGDTLDANPSGKIALIIRGTCAVSLKGTTAAAAGARAAVVYNNVAGDSPPSFAFGGGAQTIPVVTITNANGVMLRAAGVQVSLSNANQLSIAGYINGGSSRGPSIVGASLKPDVSAPGSNILSTGSATGDQPANLSGTSMAAPHVAGMFALVKQQHPTWSAQEIMAAVVNTANPATQELLPNLTSRTIPMSWQGAGLVNAYQAVKTTTLAHVPGYVASLSYGLHAVTDHHMITKQFMLANKGTTSRTYNLSFTAMGVPTGSSVAVSPTSVTLAAGEMRAVDVMLHITASGLADYALAGSGQTNPTYLDRNEISGYVKATEDGGAGDAVIVPVYAIARKASAVSVASNALSMAGFGPEDAMMVRLNNTSATAGPASLFAYLGMDADETTAQNQYDIRYVGVRPVALTVSGQAVPGLQFAGVLHGSPTLAMETQWAFFVDHNRDGTYDYAVFNDDIGLRATGSPDGRNASYVIKLDTNTVRGPFYFTGFQVGSSNFVVTVAASELGLSSSNLAFNFYATTGANWTTDADEDRAPDSGAFYYNAAAPRFGAIDDDGSVTVPANGSVDVAMYANARGFLGGDTAGLQYEKGGLILYDSNVSPARDADVVAITFPYNFRVEQTTMAANANLSGYVVNRLGDLDNQLGSGQLWTGVDNRGRNPLNFHGIAHFSLGSAGAQVEFEEAALDLTGHDASYVDARLDSRWWVHMLSSAVDANLGRATYNMIATASVDATLTPTLTDANLGVGTTNSFVLDAAARKKLSEHVRTSGGVTFRTTAEPQYSQGMHLFAWDGRAGGTAKSPTLRALTVTRLP